MIGRQVIETRRPFTLAELEQFMRAHWDTETHNGFIVDRPTPASIEKYILLPATAHYMVIAYARAAGGLFNKRNKVILSVCDTPVGAVEKLLASVPTRNLFHHAWSLKKTLSSEKERKGPAEEVLQAYAAHMRELLTASGDIA